uniref:Alpha/beta hydrolase fold-3 domain-containing protein n=1 Tax=Ananas comosus var. bracteatus TaxID=296719 RepID=A0A6V7P6F8_ANACO|nr:unnamed protein product [Ananas comosus var. bracteatus]
MDPDTEVQFEFPGLIRCYKSGRVERSAAPAPAPPSLDPITGVASRDVALDASSAPLRARLYLPSLLAHEQEQERKLPLLVYFHGGGFVVGSASAPAEHSFLNLLCARAGALALSVDYRLAPEHPLPAAYDDALAALRWATFAPDPWLARHADLTRVFSIGFSAGANIAYNAARALPPGALKGLVLIHPFLLSSALSPSEPRDAALRAKLLEGWRFACPGTCGVDDPRVNPMGPGLKDLGCERVMVCIAEDELMERGRAYYEALRASGWGGSAELVESEGEGHEFFLQNPGSEKAVAMMERLAAFINR